ncbi:MAG: Na(+)/H(+) antiporter subunit D [Deltaproteobacteria bacterium]|nr:Na(+)/H(+) antiporter subunit D [Deltaproteobacteria bacterium]
MSEFIGFPPSLIYIFGALLIPFLHGKLKKAYMLLIPVVCFLILMNLGITEEPEWVYSLLTFGDSYNIILGRVDELSRVFGYIFILITFIGLIYAINIDDDMQYMAGLIYAGGALGVTFAGDLFSLYIFWEVMAVASTFLILARRRKESQSAAFRYILIHVIGGLFLLAGIVLYVNEHNTTEFCVRTATSFLNPLKLNSLSSYLIFIGIAVNAAIPPLHGWLKDAYPEATFTGSVFLSAFTTKSAVYVMARMFFGTEALIYLGAFMTCYPIFFAEVENDMRRVLSYSLMNQVGFMMCGIGIGTQLALNGTVSHAFAHILYKALLFMSVGAVLHVTGKIKATDLGGLYKTMPITALLCIIGAMSISAFPLTSGFISKSMIISAAGDSGQGMGYSGFMLAWLMLQFASAGVIAHAGIKVPFFTFFGHDSGLKAKEPPKNMLIAMGIAAFFCIFLGVRFDLLYNILPFPEVANAYVPYSGSHVVNQLQLLMFGVFAFYLMLRAGRYPSELRAINLDLDWFYRKGSAIFYRLIDFGFNGINLVFDNIFAKKMTGALGEVSKNIPARVVLFFAIPMRIATGINKEELEKMKANVYSIFEHSVAPIGLSAAVAGIFIALMILISW